MKCAARRSIQSAARPSRMRANPILNSMALVAMPARPSQASLLSGRGAGRRAHGKIDAHRGAVAFGAFDGGAAAMAFTQGLDQGQAQPRATLGEEGVRAGLFES